MIRNIITKFLSRKISWAFSIFFVGSAFFSGSAYAVQAPTDPGDYLPLPVGSNLGLVYFQHARHDSVYSEGDKVSGGPKLNTTLGLLRFVHVTQLAGYTIAPQIILPFGYMNVDSGLGQPGDDSANGIGDPILGATTWLHEDSTNKQWFAVSTYGSLPIGEYDSQKGNINIGENRWKAILLAAYVKGLRDDLLFELVGEYAAYGDNKDFAGLRFQQADTQSIQTHLRYSMTPQINLGFSYYHDFGGETKIGGMEQDNRQDNNRWFVTVSASPVPDYQLQLQYGQAINVENGFKESHRLNLRLAKLF